MTRAEYGNSMNFGCSALSCRWASTRHLIQDDDGKFNQASFGPPRPSNRAPAGTLEQSLEIARVQATHCSRSFHLNFYDTIFYTLSIFFHATVIFLHFQTVPYVSSRFITCGSWLRWESPVQTLEWLVEFNCPKIISHSVVAAWPNYWISMLDTHHILTININH